MIFSITSIDKIGQEIAENAHPGFPILFSGPLGVGKSTLARSVIQILCPDASYIPSPSFPIMLPYTIGNKTLWHIDLYRLNFDEEILHLGILDVMQTDVCLIEWPERLGRYYPDRCLLVDLSFSEQSNDRQLIIKNIKSQR